jgi:hypothetical protein
MIPGPDIVLLVVDAPALSIDFGVTGSSRHRSSYRSRRCQVDEHIRRTREVAVPLVSQYVDFMLSDRSLSWLVDHIDPACSVEKTCTSF